jgi:hypothetical protein
MYRRNEKIERIRDEIAETHDTEYRRFIVPAADGSLIPAVLAYTTSGARLALLDWQAPLASDTIAFWVNDLGRTRMVSIDHDYGHYENLKQALTMVLPRNTKRVACCPWCGGTEYTADNEPCMPCCAGEKGVDW